MAFMLPFVSVAEDVYSAEELMNAIYEFNSTEDAELVIVLKADITDAVDFSTCEGKTYYIDGNTFTLADVAIYANGGDVTIDADVEGAGAYSEAVSVYSDSEVETNIEVNGDITGGDTDEEWDGAGVGLVVQGENIEVLVDGDVTGGNATGGNSAGIETEAGNGVYVVLHVKHEGDGRSWENGETFVKGVIEGGADSNGERAAAIHLDGRYADLPGEADDNYLTELTPVDGVYSFVVPEDGQVIVSAEFEKIVVEPEEPKEEPKENSKTEENVESVIPKTNDINSFGIYVGLMIISLVCVVVVYKKTKKYNI